MDICALVGLNVRRLRNQRRLTQDELAAMSQIDRSYLSEIENGHKNVGVVVLAKLADILEVSPEVFFRPAQSESSPQESL